MVDPAAHWHEATGWLRAYPGLWLVVTGAVFLLADKLFRAGGRFALLNPVLLSILALIAILHGFGVSYADYFAGAQMIHLLLGPATVALAMPLYLNLHHVRAWLVPLTLALAVGCVVGMVSALALGQLFGLSPATLLSFAPKSVTTPIAMALAAHQGGIPALTANVVILTGVLGAVAGLPLMRWLKVDDPMVQGFALGVAAHGIGTARALQESETAGAFGGLAMGLNAVLTSLLLPLILAFWPGL
ncbi:membrane protein [Chitiniphilus shinanonensis]|uniref:Membrane protein n=1 Tax=Chitiniphilus shinanonensis TaxID=553088 RepID=A0ABQ6BSV9_9NEIS|nr:LrgB family protein [Chitiniphilus shinanonensis]GLS05093.1 membrane protein [Chitiniphilus shinanonensis]